MSRTRAQELHAQGVTKREIADRLGVSEWTVIAWLRRRPTFPERRCRLCSARFTPTNGRQRFCSQQHWEEHRRGGPILRECRHCGRAFTPASGGQRYCAPEHRDQHNKLRRRPTTTADWLERVRVLEAELVAMREQLGVREAA